MPEISAATFEGLFIHALKVEGPIVDKLRKVGFDPTRMETTYKVAVWKDALRVASLEYYPTLSSADAEFQLGVRFVDGYFSTLVGKLLAAGMPFLKADSLCARLPRFFTSGVVEETQRSVVTKVGERHYTGTMFGESPVPYLTAGAVDAALRKMKVIPTVKVLKIEPESFTIDITWVEPR